MSHAYDYIMQTYDPKDKSMVIWPSTLLAVGAPQLQVYPATVAKHHSPWGSQFKVSCQKIPPIQVCLLSVREAKGQTSRSNPAPYSYKLQCQKEKVSSNWEIFSQASKCQAISSMQRKRDTSAGSLASPPKWMRCTSWYDVSLLITQVARCTCGTSSSWTKYTWGIQSQIGLHGSKC